VDLRTINIGTGAIENTMTRDYKGEIDGLITTIERISWELVGLVHPDELLQDLLDQPPTPLEEVATRQPQQEEPEPSRAEARPKKKGGRRLLFAAAIIVGGGGAYYILTQGEEDTPYEPPTIGMPPAFPEP
jgi:hypothetical protein